MEPAISIFGIPGIPEIKPGDNLPEIIMSAARLGGIAFEDGDVVVIAQKVVSKAEGRVFRAEDISVSEFARQAGRFTGHPPEYMEVVLRESKRIVRMANGVLISQTGHGFVMANAGVDCSNAGGRDLMVALPRDPDHSARTIREHIESVAGKRVAVIISDTFGRPWRNGQVNQAVGVSGLRPILDYRGEVDNDGRELKVTQMAVADELASAAELASGKTGGVPVVIIRGYRFEPGGGKAIDLVREDEKDIFK